jgi:phospholipid/cholesterol/gamma-HCH transport system ATP-binding protein
MLFNVFISILLGAYSLILIGIFCSNFLQPKTSKSKRVSLQSDRLEDINVLKLLDVTKSFDQPVLQGISLAIRKGETVGILGQSGTGKSVLLKIVAGFLRPDQGQVFFKGRDIGEMSESNLLKIHKQVSYIFQSSGIFDSLSVGENIAYPLREQGITDEKIIRDRVDCLLEMVDLAGQPHRRYNQLTVGGKKQVAIARAIANNPEVILYDEPTTGVDPIIRKSLSQLIRKLNRQEKITSVVVTHDLRCLEVVADRVILLKDGSIHFEGDLSELKASEDTYIKAFIGGQRYTQDNSTRTSV